jgi:phage shock protein E
MVYVIGAVVIVFIFFLLNNSMRKPDVDLVHKYKNGAVLLDVRSEREYELGTLNGAINIPHNVLAKRIDELDKTQTYITFCSQGVRSIKAKRTLRMKGLLQSYNGGAIHDLERKLDKSE